MQRRSYFSRLLYAATCLTSVQLLATISWYAEIEIYVLVSICKTNGHSLQVWCWLISYMCTRFGWWYLFNRDSCLVKRQICTLLEVKKKSPEFAYHCTAISFVLFAYNPLPDFYCFKMEHLTVPVSFLFHAPSYLITPSNIWIGRVENATCYDCTNNPSQCHSASHLIWLT